MDAGLYLVGIHNRWRKTECLTSPLFRVITTRADVLEIDLRYQDWICCCTYFQAVVHTALTVQTDV
jgi:hypothetical protein